MGHSNSSDLFTPLPIEALQGLRIKQIACGDNHCMAVTMDSARCRVLFSSLINNDMMFELIVYPIVDHSIMLHLIFITYLDIDTFLF